MSEELICITCPLGCHLTVDHSADGSLAINGNRCPRGVLYANEELLDPRRMVSATARIANPALDDLTGIARLPVRTSSAYPKEGVKDVLAAIHALSVRLPVRRGDILIKDFKGSGVDILATRTLG
jgi:CxxC motif-containing protein